MTRIHTSREKKYHGVCSECENAFVSASEKNKNLRDHKMQKFPAKKIS